MNMNEPRLRFKADDGSEFPDWEDGRLGELCSYRRGSFPQPYGAEEWYDEKNGKPFIQVADVGDNMKLLPDTKRHISKAAMPMSVFVDAGTLIVTLQGSIGRIAITDYDAYIDRTLLIIQNINSILKKEFLQYALFVLFADEKKRADGGTIKTITKETLTNFTFEFPCLAEQQKIAEFLSTVDTVIEKQKETVSAWEERKKGVMQKLFSQELRFKADDGSDFPEWEEKKIGDLFYKVNERNNGQFGKDKWISVAKMYYQDEDKVTSNNIDTRTYVMRVGDMSFEGHPNKEFKYGRFVVNDIGDGIISELFPIYRHKENYILKYWKYAIQVDSIMQKIYRKSITSSGASSNKLDDDDFKRQSISVPCLEEQQKIADCLSSLDEVIEKQKATLAAWEALKKGLLQQMFV